MKTIILTGMMGAGKTTVAKHLETKLNLKSIDIDAIIEQNEGVKVSDIFVKKGEFHFRKIEEETIKKIFKSENLIISLGGGAFENSNTRELLLKHANVFYLKTSPKIIYKRIKNDVSRPLLHGNMSIEKISEILEKREKNYQSATYIITTDNKTPTEIAEEITGVLQ